MAAAMASLPGLPACGGTVAAAHGMCLAVQLLPGCMLAVGQRARLQYWENWVMHGSKDRRMGR